MMSGAGKSVTVCDLLSQTEGYFDYTVIIEEGLSYGLYTQTVEPDARSIIILPAQGLPRPSPRKLIGSVSHDPP